MKEVGERAARWPPLLFWAAAFAMVGLSLAAELRAPLNSDAAWLLYTAERVSRGERLYTDILEINPPLVVWLNLFPAALGRLLRVPESLVFRLVVALIILGSTWLSERIIRRMPSPWPRLASRPLALAILFALLLLVGGIYGQREHLALALVLPLVALAALRVDGGLPPRAWALSVGLLAATGIALKPHFVLVWLLLLIYKGWSRVPRAPRLHAEDAMIGAAGTLYVLAVLTLTPEYLGHVLGAGRDYLGYGAHSIRYILLDDSPAIYLYAALVVWAILRYRRPRDPWGASVALAGVGFLAAVVVQHKGWSYHFYPSNACALLLSFSAVLSQRHVAPDARLGWRVARRAVAGIAAVLLVLLAARLLQGVTRRALGELSPRQAHQVAVREAVSSQHGARSILVLSSQLRDAFPLVNDTGLEWHGSYPVMWVPLIYYRSYAGPSRHTQYRTSSQMSPPERFAFQRVVRDLVQHPPDLLVVESRKLNERRTRFPGGFDHIAYFGQDAAFAEIVRQYRPVADVDGLVVMRRSPGEHLTGAQS